MYHQFNQANQYRKIQHGFKNSSCRSVQIFRSDLSMLMLAVNSVHARFSLIFQAQNTYSLYGSRISQHASIIVQLDSIIMSAQLGQLAYLSLSSVESISMSVFTPEQFSHHLQIRSGKKFSQSFYSRPRFSSGCMFLVFKL